MRFVGLLLILLILWELVFRTDVAQRTIFEPHLRLYAQLCGGALRLLGEQGVSVVGAVVVTKRFSVSIVEGCDAIQALGLIVAAVLASPVPWRTKPVGLLLGSLFLTFMNLVRIVILYYVGVHTDLETFHWAHRDVSQLFFILLVVLTWVTWARWAVRKQRAANAHAVPVPA